MLKNEPGTTATHDRHDSDERTIAGRVSIGYVRPRVRRARRYTCICVFDRPDRFTRPRLIPRHAGIRSIRCKRWKCCTRSRTPPPDRSRRESLDLRQTRRIGIDKRGFRTARNLGEIRFLRRLRFHRDTRPAISTRPIPGIL